MIAFPAFDLWSIFLLFGALQGVFFAVTLLLHQKGNKASNRLLSFLLSIFSLHLVEYVMVSAGFYQQAPHFIGATLPVVFLIGPIYYLYAISLLQDEFHIDMKRALHFVPAILCYLALLPFYAQAPESKIAFLAGIIQSGFVIFPLDLFLLMALSTCQMLIYFYLMDPIHDQTYYSDFAEKTGAPFVFFFAPLPIFLLVRWVGRKAPDKAMIHAVLIVVVMLILDVSIVALAGRAAELFRSGIILANVGKIVAALWGGWMSQRESLVTT